jgi:hypothetical protein
MPTDITSVTVTFGHGVKREEYGPVKKAEVSVTATVPEGEDGTVALAYVSHMAMARVAEMLSAPKPETGASAPVEVQLVGELPPARRTRAPDKAKDEPQPEETKPEATPTEDTTLPPAQGEWGAGADDIVVSDAELLSATSKRAGELGAREPIVKLIATFATRTVGSPFKVQEIPAAQRKDYLTKLAALTA